MTSPTVRGDPLDNHIILFENANYHGAHKHVFTREPNLNAADDNFFNDKVSSLAIFQGNWMFFKNSGFAPPPYPPGPGAGGGAGPKATGRIPVCNQRGD
jgi:Beta/Gamma crystallin